MAGLGLGLGISSGVNGPGHDAGGVTDALYFLTSETKHRNNRITRALEELD